jgi:hypothetical protein
MICSKRWYIAARQGVMLCKAEWGVGNQADTVTSMFILLFIS